MVIEPLEEQGRKIHEPYPVIRKQQIYTPFSPPDPRITNQPTRAKNECQHAHIYQHRYGKHHVCGRINQEHYWGGENRQTKKEVNGTNKRDQRFCVLAHLTSRPADKCALEYMLRDPDTPWQTVPPAPHLPHSVLSCKSSCLIKYEPHGCRTCGLFLYPVRIASLYIEYLSVIIVDRHDIIEV
jgi:hypothetical protein